jgi:hypothetical protein
MFFIGIFGIEEKEKELKEYGSTVCPCCGEYSRAVLLERYTYFHIFFIPTFRWNRQVYIRYRCCGGIYGIDKEDIGRFKDAADIDTARLKKIYCRVDAEQSLYRRCEGCGKEFERRFAFCPYCGRQVWNV